MNVLLTGHAGFVGRHILAALIERGDEVTSCDTMRGVDCRWMFAGPRRSFDLVIHCAATIGGRVGIDEHAAAMTADNLSMDAEMFRWALRNRPRHVVYLSSSAAYPTDLQGQGASPLREDDLDLEAIRNPDAGYGWTKLAGEKLAALTRESGLNVHVVRPFSGYGEDQSVDYPFTALARHAKAREDPFTIWGDGDQVRDFVHVDDLVATVLLMVDEDIPGPLNIGTGKGTSMRSLAALMCEHVGYTPEFRSAPDKPHGVAHRVADTTALDRHRPARVTLAEGVARCLG